MRVLVRVVHDADDRDPVAADLAGDVAIEILRRHHGDLAVGGACAGNRGKREEKGKGEPGGGLHVWKACIIKCNRGAPCRQYVTL
jgi:hypothetical protein